MLPGKTGEELSQEKTSLPSIWFINRELLLCEGRRGRSPEPAVREQEVNYGMVLYEYTQLRIDFAYVQVYYIYIIYLYILEGGQQEL